MNLPHPDHGPTVPNCRDVGGLATNAGIRTQHGVLLRSSTLTDATDEDIAALRRTGVRTVIDLRSDWELRDHGPVPDAFDVRHVPLVPGHRVVDSREALRRGGLVGYYEFLSNDLGGNVARAMSAAADTDGAALVQCAAGKDRTGVVIALALALVGVTDHDIATDYGRTSAALSAVHGRLRDTPGYSEAVADLPGHVFRADPLTIHTFLGRMRAEYGSVRGWADHVGVSPAAVADLRRRLVGSRRSRA